MHLPVMVQATWSSIWGGGSRWRRDIVHAASQTNEQLSHQQRDHFKTRPASADCVQQGLCREASDNTLMANPDNTRYARDAVPPQREVRAEVNWLITKTPEITQTGAVRRYAVPTIWGEVNVNANSYLDREAGGGGQTRCHELGVALPPLKSLGPP